jgi:hypothetical protein
VFEKNKSSDLSYKITEQMTVLNNLLKMYDSLKSDDASVNNILNDLKSIKQIYDEFDTVKKQSAMADSLAGPIKVTAEEFDSISKKIQEVRTKIVAG